jgi:hypothetical protein
MKKGLLLGAGFSYDLGMPLASELTEVFFHIVKENNIKLTASKLAEHNPYGDDRPINEKALLEALELMIKYKKNNETNYEAFLTDFFKVGQHHIKSLSDKDSFSYLLSIFYDVIWNILVHYQKISYEILYEKNKKYYEKLQDLFSDNETWVFTLNHDLFMEFLALDFNIPITYGDNKNIIFPLNNIVFDKKIEFTYSDTKTFNIESMNFFQNKYGINLVKLHGGLSEFSYKDKSIMCNLNLHTNSSFKFNNEFLLFENMSYWAQNCKVPSGKDKVITNEDKELDIITKSMLMGGNKYSQTSNEKKGEEKLKVFDDILLELDEVTIIGYGFGDNHINIRLLNAMVLNKKLSIRIVEPNSISTPSFLQQFDYDNRIKKAQCGAMQWFEYYKNEKWNQELTEYIKNDNTIREKIKEKVMQVMGFNN